MTGVAAMMTWIAQSCTLPTEEQPLRVAAWDALFAERLTALRQPSPLMLNLVFDGAPGVESSVRDLAAREGGCSFFTFTVTSHDGQVRLNIEVGPAHEAVLRTLKTRAGDVVDARLGR